MPEELIQNKLAEYEQALENRGAQVYVFRLYVTGASPQSLQAIENLKQLCDENFSGRYELDVFDIYQQPELAKQAQLVAAPTLIKDRPLPVRRLIGNLSNTEETLKRLDAIPEGKS